MTLYNSPALEAELAYRRAALHSDGRWTPTKRGSWFRNPNRTSRRPR
jgi:hypothetical protein